MRDGAPGIAYDEERRGATIAKDTLADPRNLQNPDPIELPESVRWLVQKLVALPEVAMRHAVLSELALESAPLELAPVLEAILAGAAGAFEIPPEARLAVISFLAADKLDRAQREELLLVALSQRLPALARALHPGEEAALAPALARALREGRRPLTLGERRSLAAGWDRRKLQRLLSDLDPLVVERLLVNPRLREEDVLELASRRPNRPEVLRLIFDSRRWGSHYAVQVALVLNPHTPPSIAMTLLTRLHRADLRLVVSNFKLPERIRAAAAELLRRP